MVKKIIRRTLRILLITVLCVIILIVAIVVLIQTPPVQNFARKKVVSYLQSKLHTKFELEKLRIGFPKKIILENIYLEDLQKDTLLSGGRIEVDISMFRLLQHTLQLNEISLKDVTVKIKRILPDSSFNFDFISKAFAGAPKTPSNPADTASAFKIQLGTIHLQKVSATYRDDATGNDLFVFLGDFQTFVKNFDIDHYNFSIPQISFSGVQARFRQYQPVLLLHKIADTITAHKESSQPVLLSLGKIEFTNSLLAYQNDISSQRGTFRLGTLEAQSKSIDLDKINFQLSKLALKNSNVEFSMDSPSDPPPKSSAKRAKKNQPAATSATSGQWKFGLEDLQLENNNIAFDNGRGKSSAQGMDYNHLHIDHLVIDAKQVSAGNEGYSAQVKNITFHEAGGFTLKKLSVALVYNDHETQVRNLLIQTANSTIRNQTLASYSSLKALTSQPGDVRADISFDHSIIAAKDILQIAPGLAGQLKGYENSVIRLNGRVTGIVKDLSIPGLEISALSNTDIQISGRIKGIPDFRKANYNIVISKFVTSRKDIVAIVPAKSMPSSLRIPETISLKGKYEGTVEKFSTQLSLQSSNGAANVNGLLDLTAKTYDLRLTSDGIDLGYILKQDTLLGKISLEATAKGNGFDYRTMNSKFHVHLTEGEIKSYTYKNLLLDGDLAGGHANIRSGIDDENIRYNLEAKVDVKGRYPAVSLSLKLDTLNPHALHLVQDSMHLKLIADANFTNTNPDSLQGEMQIYNISFANQANRLTTDTVWLIANASDSGEHIRLNSELAQIDWLGHYKLTEVGQALEQTISKYYKIRGLKPATITPEDWKLTARFQASPLVLQMMPALRGTDTIHAELQFNSRENDLKFKLNAPKIQYGSQVIHNLKAGAATKDTSLNYLITLDDAGKPGFQLHRSMISGRLSHDELKTIIDLKDAKDKNRYYLSARLSQVDSGYSLMFVPDSLILNYDKWEIPVNNSIRFVRPGIVVQNFKLSNGQQSLLVQSVSPEPTAPLNIKFDQFRIRTLTSFAEQDSLLADGLLNGDIQVKNMTTKAVFTSDLKIQDLTYKRDTVGNVTVKISNETDNAFRANISLKGHNNDLEADGVYYTGESKMNVTLNLVQLDLSTVKPFSFGQISDAKGYLKGKLVATGNLDQPVLNGDLHFENAQITPRITGEMLKISSDSIEFDSDGFNFSEFAMLDSAGDKATLDGNVFTKDYRKYSFDIAFNTKNFRVINAPKEPDRMFYGKLNVDASLNVEGEMETPKVDANLRVNKTTDLVVILPSDNPEVQSREGVVVFVDDKHKVDTVKLHNFLDSLSKHTELKGMDVSVEIETDSAAQFTMVIDERNGDALAVKGRAYLAGGIDKSGKMNLTGNYELEGGSYNVSLSLLHRKFLIQKGSTITWTGEPTAADVNISAVYLVNTPPIDLVQQQLSGRSSDEVNKFKQKLPFSVVLKMTGELLKPIIKFDITLPQDLLTIWPEVDYKLQQIRTDESEMNKQVFALLLLGRFVEENPFQSAASSTDAETLARQSVSKILADQMNQLAASLVKGVDINFDLTSDKDYSTGTGVNQTRLDVGVSKSLFNDRIKVTVGSNFQLENTYENQNTSNIAGDVSVDYRLSRDGRYMVRVYRKDQYETIVEGQVVETGVSFILTLDYNQLKELFQKSKGPRDIQQVKKTNSKKKPPENK